MPVCLHCVGALVVHQKLCSQCIVFACELALSPLQSGKCRLGSAGEVAEEVVWASGEVLLFVILVKSKIDGAGRIVPRRHLG